MSGPEQFVNALRGLLNYKVSQVPNLEKNVCWLCGKKSGETPPVCSPNHSRRLMTVCNCGTKAHKKCIVDCALDYGTRRGKDRRLSTAFRRQETLYTFGSISSYGPATVGLCSIDPQKQIYTSGHDVDCPRCGRSIVFLIKPSRLMSLYDIVHEKLLLCRELIPVPTMAGLAYLCFRALKRAGEFMWGSMADDTTISKILGIPTGTVSSLVPTTLSHLIPQIHLATLPMVFFSMRFDSPIISGASYAHTAISMLTRPTSPSTYALPALKLIDFVYDGIKRMTYGQYYYRSFATIPPAMLPYTYREDDLHFLAHEHQRIEALTEDIALQVASEPNWFWKCMTWLSPDYSEEILDTLDQEDDMLLRVDYQTMLHDQKNYWNFFWKIGTTILWPLAGACVGGLLGQYTPINKFLSLMGTDGEISFLRNVLGTALVAVVRDFFRLFLAWRAFRHYDMGVEVVDQAVLGSMIRHYDDLGRENLDQSELSNRSLEVDAVYHRNSKPPTQGIVLTKLMISPPMDLLDYEEEKLGEPSLGAYLFGDLAWSLMPFPGEFERNVINYLHKWVFSQ